jgi:hypothetical protein
MVGMGWQEDLRRDAQTTTRRGEQLQDEFYQQSERDREQADRYRGQVEQFYRQLMEEGGYSPEEAAQILQQEGYDQLLWNAGDEANSQLTEGEQAQIMGDAYAGKKAYDSSGLWGALESGNQNRRGAWDAGTAGAQTALDRFRERQDAAIGGAELGPGREYLEGSRGSLGRMEGRVLDPLRGADELAASGYEDIADPLSLSGRYQDAMTVGDEEVTGLEKVAQDEIRGRTARVLQDAERRALQGGTANPLAIAALQREAMQESNLDAADAAVKAKMGALGYRREMEDQMEARRLNAEGQGAGIRAEGLGRRLGLAGAMSEAGRGMTAQELDQMQRMEDSRYRGQAAGLSARLGAAESYGQAALGEAQRGREGRAAIEQNIAGDEQRVADEENMRRVQLEQQGEAENQRRAAGVAGNAQQTRQQNFQNRYTANTGILDRRSGNYQGIYGNRQQQRQAGGAGMGNLYQTSNQNSQEGLQRRLGAYQATAGAQNQANSTWAQSRSQPGFWSRMAGAVIGGVSSGLPGMMGGGGARRGGN